MNGILVTRVSPNPFDLDRNVFRWIARFCLVGSLCLQGCLMTVMRLAVNSHVDEPPPTIRFQGMEVYRPQEMPKRPYRVVGLVSTSKEGKPFVGPASDGEVILGLIEKAKDLKADAIIELTIVPGNPRRFVLDPEGTISVEPSDGETQADSSKSGAGEAIVFLSEIPDPRS